MKNKFFDFFINKLNTVTRLFISIGIIVIFILTYCFIPIKALQIVIYILGCIFLAPLIMTVFLDLFGTRTTKGTPLKEPVVYLTNDLSVLENKLIEQGFVKNEQHSNGDFILKYDRLTNDIEETVDIIFDFYKYQKWCDSLKNLSSEEIDRILTNNRIEDETFRMGLSLEIIVYSEQFSELNFEDFCQKVAIHNQIYFNGYLSIYLSYENKVLKRYTKLPRFHRKQFIKLANELFIREEQTNGD